MNLIFFKRAFLVTAVVNILAGLSALIALDLHTSLFYGRTFEDSLVKFYHYNLWFAIFVLGIGYYYLSLKPIENSLLALIGGLVKLFIASTWILLFSLGEARIFLFGPIVFDLFYGILLIYFYFLVRKQSKL